MPRVAALLDTQQISDITAIESEDSTPSPLTHRSPRGVPIAKLVPFHTSSNRLASLGMDRERFIVPEDFNAALPEEILAAFEGGEE